MMNFNVDISNFSLATKIFISIAVIIGYIILNCIIKKRKEGILKIYLKLFLIVYVNFFTLMAFWLFGSFKVFLILVLLLFI